jgi:23S rRNA U2552 (ribose-2'-O)-methylase RlmE/FtsJ
MFECHWIRNENELEKIDWSIRDPTRFIINCHLWDHDHNHDCLKENKRNVNLNLLPDSLEFLLRIDKNEKLTRLKNALDAIPKHLKNGKYSLFSILRNATNPYESIGNLQNKFQNRSAIKLMEINHILNDYLRVKTNITNSTNTEEKEKKLGQQYLNILDLCGAPGGFTEFCFYYLRHLDRSCVSTGITLSDNNNNNTNTKTNDINWNIDRINEVANLPQTNENNSNNSYISQRKFKAFYGSGSGSNSSNNNGDITKPEIFQSIIKETENNGKYDAIFADGGFSVEGDENNQEVRHLQLILAQMLIGILTSKPNGIFTIKIFDQQCNLSKYLTLLTAQFFESFTIKKLCQSRPASSERYIIFSGRSSGSLNQNDKTIIDWMLTLYIGFHQKCKIHKQEQNDQDQFKGFGGASANDDPSPLKISIDIIEIILKQMIVTPQSQLQIPISINEIETGNDKIRHQWLYIQDSQKVAETIQIEYLTILNEIIGIFTLYPLILQNSYFMKNINIKFNIINRKLICTSKELSDMKTTEWLEIFN